MEYQTTVKSVIDAVRNDINTVNKWQTAGSNVREFYGSEAALQEVKAQFTADAILPALDKRHAAALGVDLPRKGSKEYNALDASGVARWEAANQAKKDARATAATMFSRIVKYAFPKESESEASTPKTLETRLLTMITEAIGKIEKAEAPNFDATQALYLLRQAATTISAGSVKG